MYGCRCHSEVNFLVFNQKSNLKFFSNKMSIDILGCHFVPFSTRMFCLFLDSRVNTIFKPVIIMRHTGKESTLPS